MTVSDQPIHKELDKKTLALGLSDSMREGVLFSTYAMLASSGGSKSKNSRLDQIVAWCGGPDFDGCIIFDECHRAKNCVSDAIVRCEHRNGGSVACGLSVRAWVYVCMCAFMYACIYVCMRGYIIYSLLDIFSA